MSETRRHASRHPNIVKDKTGVWTSSEAARESLRRRAAQTEAATAALAQTEQKIAEIRADASRTDQEKLRTLRMLTASGLSDEEFAVLRAAQEAPMD